MTTASRFILLSSSNWHPRKLFLASELGTIQNQSKLESVFQDSNAATPGAIGQTVGMLLDDRYLQARGAELAASTYATVTGGDNITTATSASSFTQSAGTTSSRSYFPFTAAVNAWYEITFRIVSISAGTLALTVRPTGTGTGVASVTISGLGVGTYHYILQATTTAASLNWTSSNLAVNSSVDSISVKLVDGYHALQATAGSRPTLNSGNKINFSSGTKSLVTTWGSSLGSACTVAHAIPQGDASILTAQTIATTYTDTTDNCALVIINRALSATETNQLRRWLNRLAG